MAKSSSHLPRHARAGNLALGWIIARVPFDPASAWPKMIRLRVRGEINGHAFRTSLFPDPRGGFYLLVNRAMQKACRHPSRRHRRLPLSKPTSNPAPPNSPTNSPSSSTTNPASAPGTTPSPSTLAARSASGSPASRSDDTRMKRAEQMAERLLATMEAEAELPPLIAAAFRAQSQGPRGLGQA